MSKPDPKAKVRNKQSPVFDAKHPKVKDNKDHFPLGSESQARNALARANQFKKAPEWWSGTLEQLVSAVVKAVGKEYKGIEISDKSKKPGKGAELINTLTKLAVDNSEIYTDIISEIKHKVTSNQSFRGWKATELNLLLAELGEAQVKIATDRELWSDSPVAQRGSPEEGAFAMPEETEPSDPFDKVPPGIDSDIFFKIERAIESAGQDIKEMKFSWEKYKTNPRKYEPQLNNLKYAANNIIKVLKHLVVDKISDNNSAEDEKKQSYNYGECPDEAITEACMQQCPDGFPMTIRSKDEWRALAEAWNQGIDSHLEGMARSTADNTTGQVLVHPAELCTLLRRLNNSDNEVSSDLRSGILQSLGIEEI